MELPKTIDESNGLFSLSTNVIDDQFSTIEDLTAKALLATNHQTFARRKIKSLTIKLLSKLKRKGKLDRKGKKVKLGQLVLRSRLG